MGITSDFLAWGKEDEYCPRGPSPSILTVDPKGEPDPS